MQNVWGDHRLLLESLFCMSHFGFLPIILLIPSFYMVLYYLFPFSALFFPLLQLLLQKRFTCVVHWCVICYLPAEQGWELIHGCPSQESGCGFVKPVCVIVFSEWLIRACGLHWKCDRCILVWWNRVTYESSACQASRAWTFTIYFEDSRYMYLINYYSLQFSLHVHAYMEHPIYVYTCTQSHEN